MTMGSKLLPWKNRAGASPSNNLPEQPGILGRAYPLRSQKESAAELVRLNRAEKKRINRQLRKNGGQLVHLILSSGSSPTLE